MLTLTELEELPELKTNNWPLLCMRCKKSIAMACNEVMVYRDVTGKNVSFEEARQDASVEEIVTAHICFDCNDELYANA
jgi:hypothetical protein